MYTVLIVDDEISERNAVRFLLERDFPGRLHMMEASNGKDSLDILKRDSADILLTDVQMPFLNGIDLAQQARLINPDLEILFFSGYDDFEYVQRALMLQAINYVLKPINPELFCQSFQRILDRLDTKVISFEKSSSFYDRSFFEATQTDAPEAPQRDAPETTPSLKKGSVELYLQRLQLAIQMKKPDEFSDLLEEFLTELPRSTYSHVAVRHACMSLLHMIIEETSSLQEQDFDTAAKAVYTYRYFSDVESKVRHYAAIMLDEMRCEADSSSYPVYQVKQYINEHYSEELSLNLLADYVYLSPNYLSNMFTRVTGSSLNKYIRQIRMKKARELLIGTNMKVTDVGKAVGYANTSYFIKAFQAVFGMTPVSCRTEATRNNPEENS